MAKFQKKDQNNTMNVKNTNNFSQEKKQISASVEQKIKDALVELNKKDKKEVEKMFGKGEFTEQLRKYFEENNPALLDELENKEHLKIYVEQLKNNGFTLQNLVENAKNLNESFKESDSEYDVSIKSITKLKDYCEKEKGRLPSGMFDDFARFSNIETTPISIDSTSKIKKASDINTERNKFLEDKKIVLNDTQKNELNKITKPNYAPTTRLLASAAIKKIRKNLPKELQKEFDSRFPRELTITSEIQNLNDLKNQRNMFLQDNAKSIDKDLAKKLDNIKVLNQDMYEEFENEGIVYNRGKGFTEQEQEFRIIFNKLATRQLFDDINKTNAMVDIQIDTIAEVFNGFPPYVNEIFKKHKYDETEIANADKSFSVDINKIDEQLKSLEKDSELAKSESEREEIIKKIKAIREEKNKRKRIGYAKYLESKTDKLGKAVHSLIVHKFDVSKLEQTDQQILANELVNAKLHDVIKDGTAELLGIDEEKFLSTMKDVFDLEKKQITIPSPIGDIIFDCPEKKFLGGPLLESLEMGSQGPILTSDDKKNLPLNIKLLLSEDNKDFFERSEIFGNLFNDFEAQNGKQRLHDGYRVRVKNKEGGTKEGYLSSYPPRGEQGDHKQKNNIQIEGGRYLYSKPITRPEDDRELLFRDDKNPIIIGESETKNYDVNVVSRELNLNGKGIGALLFGATAGQYAQENQLNNEQSRKIDERFEKLEKTDLYRDTLDKKEVETENREEKPEEQKENKEKSDYEKCIESWKNLGGYQTIDMVSNKKDKENNEDDNLQTYGFEKGAKLIIPSVDSEVTPENGAKVLITIEITEIDTKNGRFKVKMNGGETKLGKYEGFLKTLPLSPKGIKGITDFFGGDVYKLPKGIEKNPNNMIGILDEANINGLKPGSFFKDLERSGSKRIKTIEGKKEEAMYFGKREFSPGETMDAEPTIETLCKVEYNQNKERPYTILINHKIKNKEGKYDTKPDKLEMDPIHFALFMASRGFSPRSKEEVEQKEKKGAEGGPNQAEPPKKVSISIASITGMFKTITKKIGDGMKKYEEKQTEELTEAIMIEGNLMGKLAKIMPSDKLKDAFMKTSAEYMLERDNKVWTKIETFLKFYETDPDFGGDKMRGAMIKPFLDGKVPFKNHWQAAAMLLATIKKGKGPYSRNADWAGKGNWIKILMGEGHQQRYLKMKENLEQELKEGINTHGQQWANDKQNEILKLEMKYITHVIDGRQLRSEDTPTLEAMFSKKFAAEVEERSNLFFKETATGAYNNTKDISFELARFEYFRLLGDRPQQAIGNLKAVAEKAVTASQWRVFESMVLTGMLSGIFNSITQEDKKFIEKVCRTVGFLPGLLIRQPNVHHKIAKLLDVATDGKFTKSDLKYNPSNFDFGKMANGNVAKDFVNYYSGFNKRYTDNAPVVKKFISFEREEGKPSLIDIYEDPKTSNDVKQILGEIIGKRYETNEGLDPEVKANGKSLQQNLLCRNQSLISEIIEFKDGSFKGKDKDEIEDAKVTRKKIRDAINNQNKEIQNKKNTSDIIFTLKMFTNRFEDKGFNSEQKKFLIRLLKTVKEEKEREHHESAKQILRYGIVGKIIRTAGSGQVPDELKAGLETFKDFFEQNLDTILTESVINEGFGGAYVASLEKPAFKVAPWDEYVKVTEYNKFGYSAELSKEENAEQNKKKKEYSNPIIYINKTIYGVADELEKRDYGVPNFFKGMYDPEKDKKSTKKQLEETLNQDSVRLKNQKQIDEALKKKNLLDESPENLTAEQIALYQAQEDSGEYF